MTLLICLPESMDPYILSSALKSLDSDLEIIIGTENVKNPEEVIFAVVWNIHKDDLFLNFPNLKAILSYGHGVDQLLENKNLPKGVPIVRLTSKKMSEWMNEYLFAVLLLHQRQLLEHFANPKGFEWGLSSRKNVNMIGILGVGFLGKSAAIFFQKMGYNVAGWSRTGKKIKGIKCFTGKEGFNKMLKSTDFLINLLPLTIETQFLLNIKSLSKLQKGAYLVNVGRGKTIVEEDLIPLIEKGQLSGACLDVFQKEPLPEKHPFWKHEKILITPHNSSSTPPYSVAVQILENYKRAVSGKKLLNLVDIKRGY